MRNKCCQPKKLNLKWYSPFGRSLPKVPPAQSVPKLGGPARRLAPVQRWLAASVTQIKKGIPSPLESTLQPRKLGGLAHTVAVINSLIVAAAVGGIFYKYRWKEATITLGATGSFVLVLDVQLIYTWYADRRSKAKLCQSCFTHAGGIVFQFANGEPHYLYPGRST